MTQINKNRFEQHVAVSGQTFEHVSENFSKHLSYHHPFSTKLHSQDQSGAKLPQGQILCNDGYFVTKERVTSYQAKNGGALDYPGNGDTIAMCEWPTYGRIRDVRAIATIAAMDPGSANLAYFAADTAAAFPGFTLVAMDPNDATFTPIPLLDTITVTVGSESFTRQQISLAALAYGVNMRPDPLIIAATLTGATVDNSALFVFAEFVVPHA